MRRIEREDKLLYVLTRGGIERGPPTKQKKFKNLFDLGFL
jgi:hypothetical protein